MAQLVLPHTIDSGTEVLAIEHQANYEAIRDLINGNLEGGSGADSNLKANGITVRELAATLKNDLFYHTLQAGVRDAGDLKVTPGAGLALNYAQGWAFINDGVGVISAGGLFPVFVTGSTVTIPANASGNPRIDQIILTITGYRTGTVSVLQGTATVGATLANRTGAAALPSGAIRLADILMPNGFAGPFVQATHIRDRRPWARGAYKKIVRNADASGADDYSISASGSLVQVDAANLNPRMEFSGVPVRVSLRSRITQTSSTGHATFAPLLDGAGIDGVLVSPGATGPFAVQMTLGQDSGPFSIEYEFTPSAGSHQVGWGVALTAGVINFLARANWPLQMTVEELLRADASNDGA